MTLFFTLLQSGILMRHHRFFYIVDMVTIDDNTRIAVQSKRESLGLRTSEMARVLGVGPNAYSLWESGKTKSCSLEHYKKLCFFQEGLLDSFLQRLSFPLSEDDFRLLKTLFRHRVLLENAASSPELLTLYSGNLATLLNDAIQIPKQ